MLQLIEKSKHGNGNTKNKFLKYTNEYERVNIDGKSSAYNLYLKAFNFSRITHV